MDYQVYKEAGFISTSNANEWSLDEIKKMHSIPLVTWSNFDMPKQDIPLLSDFLLRCPRAGYAADGKTSEFHT